MAYKELKEKNNEEILSYYGLTITENIYNVYIPIVLQFI